MATEVWETLETNATRKEIFRELGRKMTLGKATGNTKAGNFDAKFLQITFTAANTPQRFPHGLERVPQGCLQLYDLVEGSVIGLRLEVTQNADGTYLYLKCDEARPVTLLVW